MVSIFKVGGAVDALEAQAAALSLEQAAQSDGLASLTAQMSATVDRAHDRDGEVERLRDRIAALEAEIAARSRRIEDQATTLGDQADRIAALTGEVAAQERRSSQFAADIVRIERQAAIDLAEMRETNVALAELILKQRRQLTKEDDAIG